MKHAITRSGQTRVERGRAQVKGSALNNGDGDRKAQIAGARLAECVVERVDLTPRRVVAGSDWPEGLGFMSVQNNVVV